MDFCNCNRCNKIFNHMSGPVLCRDCDKIVFDKIKEYLENNPSSTTKQISENTEISIKIIRQYIKDQRLMEIRKDLNTCILCGEVIEENLKYCIECSKKISLTNELQNMYESRDKEGPKMRFLNNNRKKR
ncbi:MAG: hypothetical protein E7157_04780 [Lactobacillales bacterium]|nr:hypothetical protein [Lactobacillales bacterium]